MSNSTTTEIEDPRSFETGESFDLGIFEQQGVSFAKALVTEVPSDNTFRVVVPPKTKVFLQARVNTPLYVRRTHSTGVYMLKVTVLDRSPSYLIGLFLQHNNNWTQVQRRNSERLPIVKDEVVVAEALAIDEFHTRHFKATLLDLGWQGLSVGTDEQVEWSELLHLELVFKEPIGRVSVQVRVVHTSRQNHTDSETQGTSLRIGGVFELLNEPTHLLIKEFVIQEIADRYARGTQTGAADQGNATQLVANEPVSDGKLPDRV